jgi:hypothetical protein
MANNSDVARLRLQIEEECEAMRQAMTGFAQTASHTIIHQRYEHLDAAKQELTGLVGAEAATGIVGEIYVKTMG